MPEAHLPRIGSAGSSRFPRTHRQAATGFPRRRRLGNTQAIRSQSALPPSVDQPHQQDYYEDDDQNTEDQLDISVVSSPRSPRTHLLSFPIFEPSPFFWWVLKHSEGPCSSFSPIGLGLCRILDTG